MAEESKELTKENQVRKGCLTQIIILIVIGVFGWYAYRFFTGPKLQEDQLLINEFLPLQASGEIDTSEWPIFTSTTGTDLSLRYSPGWELKSETVDTNEFTSFISPADENGFYFCLNLKEYFPDSAAGFDMTANVLKAEDFTAEGIGKPLNHIVYQSPGMGDLHFSVIDDVSVTQGEDVDFTEWIVNPFGWKLMIQGRFNCFDDDPPRLELNEFEDSQGVQEALWSLRTLHY